MPSDSETPLSFKVVDPYPPLTEYLATRQHVTDLHLWADVGNQHIVGTLARDKLNGVRRLYDEWLLKMQTDPTILGIAEIERRTVPEVIKMVRVSKIIEAIRVSNEAPPNAGVFAMAFLALDIARKRLSTPMPWSLIQAARLHYDLRGDGTAMSELYYFTPIDNIDAQVSPGGMITVTAEQKGKTSPWL